MTPELLARAYHDHIDGLISASVYRRVIAEEEEPAREMLDAYEESDMERARR